MRYSPGDRHHHARPQQAVKPSLTIERAPCSKHKQQLPRERIEIPAAVRIGRQIPVQPPCGEIEQHGTGHRGFRPSHQQPDHRREHRQKYKVHRQRIQIERLVRQQQHLQRHDAGLLQETCDVGLIEEMRPIAGDDDDQSDIEHEQQNLRGIKLKSPPPDRDSRAEELASADHLTVEIGIGISGNENEYLRGVAEAVVADREPADDIRRNVIEEDQPK